MVSLRPSISIESNRLYPLGIAESCPWGSSHPQLCAQGFKLGLNIKDAACHDCGVAIRTDVPKAPTPK